MTVKLIMTEEMRRYEFNFQNYRGFLVYNCTNNPKKKREYVSLVIDDFPGKGKYNIGSEFTIFSAEHEWHGDVDVVQDRKGRWMSSHDKKILESISINLLELIESETNDEELKEFLRGKA